MSSQPNKLSASVECMKCLNMELNRKFLECCSLHSNQNLSIKIPTTHQHHQSLHDLPHATVVISDRLPATATAMPNTGSNWSI